jgi:fibronectin-binding autotransporter adhesin
MKKSNSLPSFLRNSTLFLSTVATTTIVLCMGASPLVAAIVTWDGGGVAGTDLGTGVNWSTDAVPSTVTPDTAQWDGSVVGALVLDYSNTALGGAAGNPGINLDLTSGQTSSLSIDSGLNTSAIRMNGLTLAAGAGALTFGNSANAFNLTLGGAPGTHTWVNESSNAVVLNSDVTFGLGGAGAHVLALGGAGNWTLNNNLAPLSGTLTFAKNGAGTASFAGTTPAGTTTISGLQINAGILNLATDLPLGGNTLVTGAGGTINATGGGRILLNVASGDLGVANGATLTVNSIIANGTQGSIDFWNTANGTGTVVLTADSTFNGTTNLQSGIISVGKIGNSGVAGNIGTNGTLNIGATTSGATLKYTGAGETNDRVINLGGTTGGATIDQSGAGLLKFTSNLTATGGGSKTLTLQGSTTGTGEISGNIVNSSSATGITKAGSGKWTLSSATSTYTGSINVAGGTLNMSGTTGANTGNGNFRVGTVAGTKAMLNILPGANLPTRFNLFVGDAGAGTGGGAVYQSGGSLVLTQGAGLDNLRIGSNSGGYGYYSLSGGSLTTNEAGIGASLSNTVGVMDVSAGTFTNNGWMVLGRGAGTSSGILNITGGAATALRADLNWAGTAGALSAINVGGGVGAATFSTTGSASVGVNLAGANTAGTSGIVNLLTNGTLTTGVITSGNSAPNSIFNFNGGLLRATTTNAGVNFLTSGNIDSVNIFSGGGTIDNNGTSITVGTSLSAPTDNGVTSIAVTNGGSGYVGAPLVTVSGGSGTGATAVANMVDDGTGAGTFMVGSITVTNPGIYSAVPTTVALSGGGATTAATMGAIATAANTSGGMAFQGSGTTNLTTASTYTGATSVTAGTLALGSSGSINDSSGITINGGTAKLVQSSFTPVSAPVLLSQGTIDGTTTLNSVTVANTSSAIIANGSGSTSPLTIETLSFSGAATLNLSTSSTSAVLITNDLATNAAGVVTINATSPSWTNGQTYDLVSYSNLTGGGFAQFAKGTIANLGARQSATLVDNPGISIGISISGNVPVWSGALNNQWTTDVLALPKNWKLQDGGAQTDFVTNDAVIFSDAATGTTAVEISNANISASGITFENTTAKDYSISSTGGFGIIAGSISKTGDGIVSLNTANTYSGGTTISNGQLNINNASALGTGAFTLSEFGTTSIDNTSGAPITLSTNNAQVWNSDVVFGGSNALNLGTGTVTIVNSRIITTNGSGALTIGGALSAGAYSITKEGTGTLVLGGANGHTNGTFFNAGTLHINNALALGTGLFDIAGSTLDNTSGGAITLPNNQQNWNSDFTFVGSNELNMGTGAVSMGSSRALTVNGTLTVGGIISGSGSALTKNGSGTLVLGAANSYNGGTTLNAGTLQLNQTTGAAATGTINIAGGTLVFSPPANNFNYAPTVNLSAPATISKIAASQINFTGTLNGNGNPVNISTSASRFYVNGATSNGVSQFNVTAGAMGFDLATGNNQGGGAPVVVSSGASLYFANGAVPLANNITLNGGTGQDNVGALYQEGAGTPTISGSVTLNSGDSSIGGNTALATATTTVSGQVTGAGGLTKIGINKYIFTGANNYTGGTTVNAGTLAAGVASVPNVSGAFGNNSAVSMGNVAGAILDLAGFNTQIGSLTGGGTTGGNVTLGAATLTTGGNNTSPVAYAGVISGTGALTKIGTGNQILTGANSFTGDVTVNGGVLVANRGNNALNPVTSALGNPQTVRNITVNSTGTLNLSQGDVLGSATTTVAATLVINAGGVVTNTVNFFNHLGPVVMNGGTLTTAGGAIAGYQSYSLGGSVTVGGSAPSTISVTGAGNAFNGVHLGSNTTFNVADATLSATSDLDISAPLINRNNSQAGAGGLTKTGDGTMTLTGTNTYTGNTTISGGTLSMGSPTLANAADVSIATGAKLDLAYVDVDVVDEFFIDGVAQAPGSWGSLTSAATYKTALITGTGTLSVTTGPVGGFSAWATSKGLDGTNNGALQDNSDNDGIENLLEYVLGGDPLVSSTGDLPTQALDATNLVLTFRRSDLSEADTTVKVQWSADLVTWTDFATVGAGDALPAVDVTEDSPNADLDTVVVTIPRSGREVSGKLFGRVIAVK